MCFKIPLCSSSGLKGVSQPPTPMAMYVGRFFFLRLVIKVFFERLVTLPAVAPRSIYWGWTPQTPPQKKPLRRFLLFFSDRFFLNDWFFFYDWFFFNDWLRKKTTQNGIPFFCPVTPCFPFHRFQKKSKKYVKDLSPRPDPKKKSTLEPTQCPIFF